MAKQKKQQKVKPTEAKIDRLVSALTEAGLDLKVVDGRKNIGPRALMVFVEVYDDTGFELARSYFAIKDGAVGHEHFTPRNNDLGALAE